MNQYCYDLTSDGSDINATKLKNHVRDIYRKKKFKDLAFTDEEKLPFIVIYSEKDQQVCVKMTSKAKKNIERIEAIHEKLKAIDLKVSEDLTLSKPTLFELEQCAWWDTGCQIAQGQKWATLEHNGPYFVHLMEPYEPHGAPIIYDGQEYDLTPQEERIASFYARRIISEQAGNVTQLWTKDKVFNQNFWNDFKTYLSPTHKKIFKVFNKLDFTPIVERLEELKENEKQMTAKEKNDKKVKAAEKKQDYGFAIINGIKEPLGNFTIEPAAIFYGRGNNPKRGKVKRDIEPEEVIINIGKDAPAPKPPAGHKWKQVIHDKSLAWVASWKDPISNENKYVYFAAEGQLKGKSDLHKYEKARKLNKYLDKVRKQYTMDIDSPVDKYRQLGTVLYLIDHYGIRVGNEKDESETDTVGASTLRVEHVKLKPPNFVVFDFLGKDSIRYYKEIPVDENVYENIKEFMTDKAPTDQLFDLISAADINAYLKTFDKDFSAKVFRTRLASTIMAEALKKAKVKKNATQDDKKKIFTKANIEVAKILNHQRTVSEKSKQTIKKYQAELKELRAQLKEAQDAGKSTKTLDTRIKKKKDQIANKKDTLNVAINTSLTNYIDPRVVVGWSKANDMNIPKAYTATLQRKFKWAIDITEDDWDYEDTALLPEMAKLQPLDQSVKTTPVAPKAKAKVGAVKTVSDQQVIQECGDVKLVQYSPKSIAVIGDTKPYKSQFMELGSKYNPNLTIKGQKVSGWIFANKHLAELQDICQTESVEKEPLPKKATSYEQSELDSPLPGVSIIDYSDKSIAVVGDTKDIKEELKAIGGRFNKGLTVNGVKVPGWIFTKSKLEDVQALLEESVEEYETEPIEKKISQPIKSANDSKKTLDDIMNEHHLTNKEKNIIKCFGRDPNVVNFLKSELTGYNVDTKIYSKEFLARFLACLDSYNKDIKEQTAVIKKYATMSHDKLANNVVSKLKPSTVPTFMFLIFILYKVSSRMRETYLQHLVRHLSDEKDIQQCLCDNPDQESILTGDLINELPMKNLYLTPAGRCVHLDDLIMHLKTSSNKLLDPTYDMSQHGPEPAVLWTSGWELRAMLDRIQSYNYQEGYQIKAEFQKVLADVADTIPQQTKDMVTDLYALFYFPEESNNQRIVNLLVKYGYPTGDAPGKLVDAEAIVAKGTGNDLDEFRTLIGFKLGHHIMEELDEKEREAFLFAGEFAGMGKEAWGKLSMGEFCTKTFGAILHRMSNLFKGKYNMD